MTPYFGKDFFQFFPLFFSRLYFLLTGKLAWAELASDEIQIFVLGLVSIGAACIGTLLVLKKMTMLANSLSHTILLGIVIAYLIVSKSSSGLTMNFSILFIAALISGILTAVLTQVLHQVIKLQEDASIGLVFTTLFALGIVLVTIYTKNTHIGVEVVMGNADALHIEDVKIALGVCLCNLFFITLFFKEWQLICFDPGLATSLKFYPFLFTYLLMFLTSSSAISAFRAVGVLLFLAFLVGLPLTARLFANTLKKVIFYASLIGVCCSIFAVAIARHCLTVYQMPLSTSGLVVVLIAVAFILVVATRTVERCLTLSRN